MQSVARLTSTDEDFGKDHGLIHEAIVTGRKVGAGHDFWSKIAHNEDLFRKVVTLVDCNGYYPCNDYYPSVSQKRTREIMGKNFFGVEEAIQYLGENPSKAQLSVLAEVPLTEEVLESRKDTHILVAVFPMSILDIRGEVKDQSLFYQQDWYNKKAFAKTGGVTEWQLVRKSPVGNSMSKTWDEQQALLAEDEEIPPARVMVYTIIGHFLATGERLFENTYVRCSDLDSDGRRVNVGDFAQGGLFIVSSYGWSDSRGDSLGLASSLKFQN